LISLDPGNLYFIEGAKELLDEPGEWWADPDTNTIYMIPLPGDALDTPSVVPALGELLHIGSGANDSTPVSNITFEGISFQHARWWFPEVPAPGAKAAGFMQAAAGAPGAIVVENANHIRFDQCTISNVEAYGIELRGGCTDNRISRCTITGLGAGGIKIGQTSINQGPQRTGDNSIEDCTITNGGHLHHQAVGIWIGQSDHNTITHNRVAEFDYTGISIGWTWGYGPSAAGGNVVEWNDVGFLGKRPGNAQAPLGDMGGIYTLGAQPGTIIKNNYFHDIAGHTIAWGIYFDEGSTDIVAENNIVLSTSHGAFHQHYGKNNIVRGNLLMNGKEPQLWRTRREEHNSFTFENNIVVGEERLWHNGDWTSGFTLRHNLYWQSKTAQVPFPGKRTLAEWQAAGWDVDSVVADPKINLADPLHPTFGENADAQAMKWALPDLRGVGPRARGR
ncbi:MAG: right-handed parallel beta-helix repeat-containing protein, partial [Planctomycetota bacterium]|nr:right-handed parallel beta-helix repeat-containing protein [Planctomycetota bacterium]